jgi:putative NADPH-quinone reductase
MPRTVTIIQGHPDPAGGHLCHALADVYAEGAASAGHVVKRIEIARTDFPLLRTKDAFETGELPASLVPAREAIAAADHIMLIFPLWLGSQPAIVKGFLEQLMRPGIAFAYQDKGMPRQLLKGKTARVVVTMGMPGMVYSLFFRAHGLKALRRNILEFVGIGPVRETVLGMVEAQKPERVRRWLADMRRLGGQAR